MKIEYKPMKCPVCDKFYFSKLQEGDDDIEFFYCDVCGWNYDLNQVRNPNLKNGRNEMSLNEYKNWFKNKLKENSNYEYWSEHKPEPVPHKCPVCGKYEFEDESSFDICPFCGWEDDGLQNDDPNYSGGANDLSLNEYKIEYDKKISNNPNYNWYKEVNKE